MDEQRRKYAVYKLKKEKNRSLIRIKESFSLKYDDNKVS